MKPLKLTPAYKDYIWGGEKLRTIYDKKTDISPVAESWELSCHKDGYSVICGGEYDGKTLDEYIRENPAVLGTSVKGNELPILVKFIDAADNLSVQVHPSDEQAMAWEGQNGKTEMWYVITAEQNAHITYGVCQDITKEELTDAIKEKRVEKLLNTIPSKKGDVFFVEAGTIHAIGKGNLICEIQQNSNVTYRLYDYGRVGKDGKERELHIEKGVQAANCKKTPLAEITILDAETKVIGKSKYFVVTEIKLNGERNFTADEKTYHGLVVIEGELTINGNDFCINMKAGECGFVPAGLGEYMLRGSAKILLVANP